MKDYKTAIEEILKEAFGWEADIDEYGYTSKRVTILIDDLTQALLKLVEEAEREARIDELESFQTLLVVVALAKNQSKQLEKLYDLVSNNLAELQSKSGEDS